MAIYRVIKDKDNSYVMVNKFGIYDERLSWKAKGILFYCLSRPDDWDFYDSEIVKHAKNGIDAARSGIKELIKFNYIKKINRRDENGKFIKCVYEVYEKPYDEVEDDVKNEKEVDEAKTESETNYSGDSIKGVTSVDKINEKTEEENRPNGNFADDITSKDITSTEKPSMVKTYENIPVVDKTIEEKSNDGNSGDGISAVENPFTENPTVLNNNKLSNDLTNKRLILNNDNNNYNNSSSGGKSMEEKNIDGEVIDACKYYEKAGFSSVNSIIMDKIGTLVEIYTYQWTIEAIDTAVLNNRRSLNYVEGILRRWRASGKENNYGDSRNYRENKGEYKQGAGTKLKPEYEESFQNYDDSDLI